MLARVWERGRWELLWMDILYGDRIILRRGMCGMTAMWTLVMDSIMRMGTMDMLLLLSIHISLAALVQLPQQTMLIPALSTQDNHYNVDFNFKNSIYFLNFLSPFSNL
jgi:hypothetical protein